MREWMMRANPLTVTRTGCATVAAGRVRVRGTETGSAERENSEGMRPGTMGAVGAGEGWG